MNGGHTKRLDWSRLQLLTICFILSFLTLPLNAQNNKEVEKAMNKNKTLKQQIEALENDTTTLYNQIVENRRQLQQKKEKVKTLRAQNDAANHLSAEQITALQTAVDSLEKRNNILKTQYDSISKEKEKKYAELDGLNIKVSEMDMYSDIQLKQQYEQNQTLFSKRYSELDGKQVNNLAAHTADYKKMEGFAEYEKQVRFMQQNKTLYDECVSALNNKYDAVKVQQLRDQLEPLRVNKENKAQGFYKLNTAQFNEIDSIDIRLSRYKGGIRELQTIMKKVNNDPEIAKLRKEGKNRSECVKAIGKYVEKEATTRKKDWKNQSVVERYFNMVPYLDKAYKAYKHQLNANPFKTTDIEKEILSYEL